LEWSDERQGIVGPCDPTIPFVQLAVEDHHLDALFSLRRKHEGIFDAIQPKLVGYHNL